MVLLNMLLVGVAVLLSIPVVVLALEVASAIALGARIKADATSGARPRLAVLIPAHDEGEGILPTIADIGAQLEPGDRLLVVADNCSDDTAAVARAAGAEVVERHDPDQRGKGHALAFGLRHLGSDPPDMVIVVDADCRLGENALAALSDCCTASGRPAQAQYLLKAPVEADRVDQSVAEFSWLLRNHVRMLGLAAMGLPCNVRGSGMVLPWRAALAVDLGGSNLVQDTRIGLDLAEKGHPAVYCPGAVIESLFPQSISGTVDQRQRWELGTLQIIRTEVPRLLASALRQRSPGLVALALDTLIPPVVFLAALLVLGMLVTGGAALLGATMIAPLMVMLALGLLTGSVLAAWALFGRDALPARRAVSAFAFLVQKLQIYKPLLTGQKTGWKRTHRD